VGLGSERVRDGCDVEDGAVLLAFGSILREQVPLVLQRHPVVTPRLPHVRLADVEGEQIHKRAPPCQVLREGSLGA